jgi:hypothetical protein
MFYEETEISLILMCPICLELFQDPRVLPCGASACKQCILDCFKSSTKTNKPAETECYLCYETHSTPANGFPPNKALLDLLSMKPVLVLKEKSVYDHSVQEFNTFVRKRIQSLNNIEIKLDRIHEGSCALRNQVQIQTDALIEAIHDLNQRFLNELDS